MKILLLGGTGAMGTYLVNIFADEGHDIFVTSRSAHSSKQKNIVYLKGNAHDKTFLEEILKEKYDVIVDFMIYTTKQFTEIIDKILKSTKQYMFLSSSRVYAYSEEPITEVSPRLLDVCKNEEYLKTDEYALAKARQEDILKSFNKKNWTIIRPYITYAQERLQLGVLEKEFWLQRALLGKTIVMSKEIAEKYTSLTYGYDVATEMSKLAGNKKAYGEIFHIVNTKAIKWKDVLEVYLNVIEELTKIRPKVLFLNNADGLAKIMGNYYQVHYDRLYDRKFDSSKIDEMCNEKILYKDASEGLKNCLKIFLNGNRYFKTFPLKEEAYFDRLTGECTKLTEIPKVKDKGKYLIYRYTPYLRLKFGVKTILKK